MEHSKNYDHYQPSNRETEGARGISRTESESRSNTSEFAVVVGKEPKESQRKNSSSYEEKSNYGSVESVTRDASGYNSNRTSIREYSSTGSSDGSRKKITILCSFGGEILHRPQDGKLRYVGGETHSIRIWEDISWEELWRKTTSTYIHTHKIKYQLPGEDLDTLVSVSSDEALQNMMEDCNVLGDEEGSKRIRMFLFSVNDLNDTTLGLTSSGGGSQVKYVVAHNERNVGPKGEATRPTKMDEPDVQNVARDKSRVASVTAAPSLDQYSQSILSKSSNALETQSQSHSHQGQLHHDEAQKILHSLSKSNSLPGPGGQRILPLASSALVTSEGGFSEEQPPRALVGSPDMLKQEVKENARSDAPISQETEYELIRSMGKYVDCPSVKEASAITTPQGINPLTSSRKEGSHLESVPVTSSYEINPMRDLKSSGKELLTSNSAFASKHVISQTDLIDLTSSGSHLPPQSHFHSERYNHEQGESLKRLTKSDDLGSHFLGSHTSSKITQKDSVEQSGKRLNNVDPAAKTEQFVSRTKLTKHGISDNELPKFQNINSLTEIHSNYGEKRTDHHVLNPGDKTSFNKGNMNNSVTNETTGGHYNKDPASCLPNYTWLDRSASDTTSNHSPGISQPSDRTGKAASLENSSGISLQKRVSHDQSSQKDVSLIDQDHIDFSSRLPKVEQKSKAYKPVSLVRGDISANQISSKNKFDIQKKSPGVSEPSTTALHYDYAPSLVERKDAMQFKESSGNRRIPEPEHIDGIRSSHSLKPSFDNLDISSMQIIKDEDLEQGVELGSGTFGTVYQGKWRGSDVAIKRINKSCFAGRSSQQKEKMIIDFLREAEILSQLRHPNVVTFYGVVQDGSMGTLATVAEYMVDGSLGHALLLKDRPLDHQKKLTIAMGAAFGMEYLHLKDIVHFDLKCDNLLVDLKDPARPICKVTDFGLSKIKRKTLVSGGLKGTLPWMAPELLNRSGKKVSDKVDVFSFGIVLWEILTGEEPYEGINDATLIGGILDNTLRPAIPSSCDYEWKKLMEQCWHPDPVVRPTFTEIANRLRVMHAACQTGRHVHKASN